MSTGEVGSTMNSLSVLMIGTIDSSQPPTSLLKLASFEVKDVNSIQQLQNTVSLSVGISKDWSSACDGIEPNMNPGSSVVKIVLEGVYMETEDNGEATFDVLGNNLL